MIYFNEQALKAPIRLIHPEIMSPAWNFFSHDSDFSGPHNIYFLRSDFYPPVKAENTVIQNLFDRKSALPASYKFPYWVFLSEILDKSIT